MTHYPTIPEPAALAHDVARVCFYPAPRMPRVVAYKCEVVLNLVGVLPHVQAGAVYLQPARRSGQPDTLVAVVASSKREGRTLTVDWAEAIVGEVATA